MSLPCSDRPRGSTRLYRLVEQSSREKRRVNANARGRNAVFHLRDKPNGKGSEHALSWRGPEAGPPGALCLGGRRFQRPGAQDADLFQDVFFVTALLDLGKPCFQLAELLLAMIAAI